MKKSRRYAPGVRSTLFRKYGFILFAVVALTILYLWEQTQVIRLDVRIRELNENVTVLEGENNRLTAQVIALSQGSEIMRRAEDNLNMTYPTGQPTLILRGSHMEETAIARTQNVRYPFSVSGLYEDQ